MRLEAQKNRQALRLTVLNFWDLSGFGDSADLVDGFHQTALFSGGGAFVKRAAFGGFVDQALGFASQCHGIGGGFGGGDQGFFGKGFDGALQGTVDGAVLEALAVAFLLALAATLAFVGFACLTVLGFNVCHVSLLNPFGLADKTCLPEASVQCL